MPQNNPGILTLHETFCEHGQSPHCSDRTQMEIMYQVLDYARFGSLNNVREELNGLGLRSKRPFSWLAELIYGPLSGLAEMHAKGYMHRDVSMNNIFLLSLNPPRAVLADFGMTVHRLMETNPFIGPAYLWAPEVNGQTQYTNKIDIWSFALTIYCSINKNNGWRGCFIGLAGNDDTHVLEHNNAFSDDRIQVELMQNIKKYCRKCHNQHEAKLFYSLMSRMLQIGSRSRIDAETALDHEFFTLIPHRGAPSMSRVTSPTQGDRPSQVTEIPLTITPRLKSRCCPSYLANFKFILKMHHFILLIKTGSTIELEFILAIALFRLVFKSLWRLDCPPA